MKKFLLPLFLFIAPVVITAQIDIDFAFDGEATVNMQLVNLEEAGQKYCVINRMDSVTYALVFHHLDYSEYTTVNIDLEPTIIASPFKSVSLSFFLASQHVFDLDTGIELLAQLEYYDAGNELYAQVIVFNDNGSILFASDIENSNAWLLNSSLVNGSLLSSLVNTPSGTKMIVDAYYFDSGTYSFDVYSLPGALPSENPDKSANGLSENHLTAFPVPARDYVTMDYRLSDGQQSAVVEITDQQGRVVGSFHLNQNAGQVRLPVTDFTSGLYNYKLNAKRGYPRTARVLILK